MIEVPNLFPEVTSVPYRIALIGEAPGADEETMRQPFIGQTGNLTKQLMSSANILASACFFGNVSQTRAPSDQAERLSWDGWQIQSGLRVLKRDIEVFNPNVVVLLGGLALCAAGSKFKPLEARGSLFTCHDLDSPFYGRKCLATIHPAILFRQWDLMPLFQFDLRRAREEGESPELVLPERAFYIDLSPDEICSRLDNWPKGHPASIDIEGGIEQGITCIAFADSPLSAFIVDYVSMGDDAKPRIARAVNRFLRDPDIPKILQNAMYDNFCLAWKHKMPIANVAWDTMLSGWEIYPELPKGLGTQASIWTKEPFYKFERKIEDHRTHLKYCCKDAAVTYEIAQAHQKYFDTEAPKTARPHFDFNLGLLPALMYMQLRGIRYDRDTANERLAQVKVEMSELQSRIDLLAGGPLNVNSPKQVMSCLYDRMGYEAQYKKEGGRKTSTRTADVEALLTLLRKYNSNLVYNILICRQKDSLREQLEATLDPDGRIRTSYNLVGTETGRMACYKSNTGSGFNLQTAMKAVRPVFLADPGMDMFQIDLSGADGWTVAAHSARLGDPTMLEDYLAGVKPAKVIAAMHVHKDVSLARLPPSQILEVIANTAIPDWLYAACKAVQHGSCYGMGTQTMSSNILKRSWKDSGEPIFVAPADCKRLQQLFFTRYVGVLRWQAWVKMQLESKGYLECASGHVRHFFGRRRDNATYQTALSHEPQANTTYATNLAVSNLWLDPNNRRGGKLEIEPLHQIHDAVLGQWPTANRDVCRNRVVSYFNNSLTIAGQSIVIPFEGEFGTYWGDKSGGKISL